MVVHCTAFVADELPDTALKVAQKTAMKDENVELVPPICFP